MTSPAPACASDASLDENRIPFFFGPASLLIPFLIFALLSVYLFVVLKVFDLMALAGAGLTALVATVFISTCLAAVTSVAVALAGQLADRLLRRSIDPYRRAYLLAGFANSIPVVLPFSAFSLITLSAASALGDPSLTPFSLMTATFYPIALFVVFSVSIATGIGRPKMSDEPQAADKA